MAVCDETAYESQEGFVGVTWLPPAAGYRCPYVTDWVADKTRWGLSVDADEQAALAQTLDQCPDSPVTVALAR